MRNFGKLAILALFVLVAAAWMVSCGKSGSMNPNQAPTIQITSYNGDPIVNPDSLAPSDTVLFQQKIYWSGTDADGWVTGYAYRVLDENRQPISTPGNDVIQDGEGWVYHYQPGADETIPLDDPYLGADVRTIWTTSPYAVINFPAADSNGVAANVPSIFEVKCKDNRDSESEIVTRFFVTESVAPQVTITTTKGDPADKTTGTGIRFEFGMIDEDPYVVTEAWKFKYRIMKLDADGNVMDGTVSDWYWIENFERRARVLLTADTTPSLSSDYDDGAEEPTTKTRIEAIVYDQAGIASEPSGKDFWVKEGYAPGTLIYDYNIYAMGTNHFVTYQDASLNIIIPSQQTSEGLIFSTPMFKDKNENYVALWSNDIRIFMSWGFHGEYTGDNPRDKKNDDVLDEETSVNYLSEIQYFDIQLDSLAFNFPPYQGHPEYYVSDETGDWLRVPVNSDIAQEVVINNLDPTDPNDENSVYHFKVRAVDLQGVPDPTPADFTFKLDRPVPPDEKNGILIIDDEPSATTAPEPEVTEFYEYITHKYAAAGVRVDVLDRDHLADTIWDSNLHYGWDVLSPTDLQTYKCVIWHSDNPSASEKHNFYKEYDVMNLYLRHGGNVIVTGGANLADTFNGCKNNSFPLLEEYFGISTSVLNPEPSMKFIPGSILENNWYTHSVAQEPGYTDIHLNIEGLTPSIGGIIGPRGGMSGAGCFNPENMAYGVRRLYRMVLKEPGTDNYSPTQEQYEELNNAINFISYQRSVIEYPGMTQINALVAFPPSYMMRDEVKSNLEILIDEILAQ